MAKSQQYFTLAESVTSTGTGPEFALASPAQTHSVHHFGSADGGLFRLEGSLDGDNWFEIGITGNTGDALVVFTGKPALYVRANVIGFGSGSLTILSLSI